MPCRSPLRSRACTRILRRIFRPPVPLHLIHRPFMVIPFPSRRSLTVRAASHSPIPPLPPILISFSQDLTYPRSRVITLISVPRTRLAPVFLPLHILICAHPLRTSTLISSPSFSHTHPILHLLCASSIHPLPHSHRRSLIHLRSLSLASTPRLVLHCISLLPARAGVSFSRVGFTLALFVVLFIVTATFTCFPSRLIYPSIYLPFSMGMYIPAFTCPYIQPIFTHLPHGSSPSLLLIILPLDTNCNVIGAHKW
ncbi:hypothetical protein DFH09DRAFT_1170084 [Mycena vulgaris]|nr:hypothetical protein DFH09DRAFT_1170084 [Mycena vulgaris]